jgi:uncharacterized protein involved in exopolysaccharide biosynthesis
MLNPLLDAPPSSNASSMGLHAAPAPGTAPPPNLLIGVLRRWPWLLLGLVAGLVLGLLYHMQSAPVYQSSAQLLVIKNRPEMTTTGGGTDARVQFVEDYVATQVLYLKSERILELAAKQLDNQKPFQVEPPESPGERVGFLKNRFAVAREKEPGSNTMSNIVLLTFKSPHPADSPKYLRAIIEAYRSDLDTVYAGASKVQLDGLEREIKAFRDGLATIDKMLKDNELKLRGDGAKVFGISQEELMSVRNRITINKNTESALRLRSIEIKEKLDSIDNVGKVRANRLALMNRLGIQPDSTWLLGPDNKDPDSMLKFLKFKRTDMSTKYGPGHPDMVAINSQINVLEKEIAARGGEPDDELGRHRHRLDSERAAITSQLKVLQADIVTDEKKATQMSELQGTIDALKANRLRDQDLLRDKERERDRVSATSNVGGYKVEDVTRPTDGAQVAPVLVQSLLLGAVVGLLLGVGLGLWAELADRSFRSPLDIRRHLGLPILGHIPPIRTNDPPEVKPEAALDPILAAALRPHSAEAEAVRGIRTQLLFSTSGNEHQVLQITSPNPGDGKSTLSSNLYISVSK